MKVRFFRNWHFRRKVACLLLLLAVESSVHPVVSYALTTGPHQPEYISYESPGATDMVNLATGDFTFSLPAIDVPGPEGSFSLPLTYNAGIGPDQEASWVGLGWTMNAGSITRSISGFPDDASGQSQTITVQDLDGLKGWNANTLLFGKFGWNNQVGHYGNLSVLSIINAQWSEDFTSVGLIGVNVTSDGVKADPIQMGLGIFSIITLGIGGYVASAKQIVMSNVVKSAATQLAIGGVIALGASAVEGNVNNPTSGYWRYNEKKFNMLVFKKYRIWLDRTRTEEMYGALYLGNAPYEPYTSVIDPLLALKNNNVSETLYRFKRSSDTSNKGSASDVNYYTDPGEEAKPFNEINNPTLISPDQFSVHAPGISGGIEPYRMDIGSVSMPREMTASHVRLAALPFLNDQQYKVAFQYTNAPSNAYYHHVGGASSVTSPNSGNFGLSATYASNTVTLNLNDVTYKNERIKGSLNSIKRVPQSTYIEWLSNDEIKNGITYPSRYMDILSGGNSLNAGSARYQFRQSLPVGRQTLYSSTNNFSHAIPVSSQDISKIVLNSYVDLTISFYKNGNDRDNAVTSDYVTLSNVHVDAVGSADFTSNDPRIGSYGGRFADIEISTAGQLLQAPKLIGGFCITSAEGVTYHFGLPIYDFAYESEVREIAKPNTKRSLIKRNDPFANTWLLTGITGPDFIDRNSNGVIDEGDWGYWVKMNYGRHQNEYEWRLPYGNNVYRKTPSNTHESYIKGKKQQYYLNSIETRSNVALFVKDDRLDSKSSSQSVTQLPLALSEIIVIGREQYKKMISPSEQGGYGVADYSNSIYDVLKTSSISSAYSYLKLNCVKRLKLIYNYSLAKFTPNSIEASQGRLTLERIRVLGRNDALVVPDYKFEYGFNPDYDVNKWDGWGSYSSSGNSNVTSHEESNVPADPSAWSLTKIVTPLGSEIDVQYEPDIYSTVSGSRLMGTSKEFSISNMQLYYPAQVPVKRVYINHGNAFSLGQTVWVTGFANYTCGSNPTQKTATFNSDFTIAGMGTQSIMINNNNVSMQYLDLNVDYMGIGTCGLVNSGSSIKFSSYSGSVTKVLNSRSGGGIRVNTITSTGPMAEVPQKMKYAYTNGCVSRVPDYIYVATGSTIPDYTPQTPVIYGEVEVRSGKLSDPNDYHSSVRYNFETPRLSQYTLTSDRLVNKQPIANYDFLYVFENKFQDRTSRLGAINSVSTYNVTTNQSTTSEMHYTENIKNDDVDNYQGIFTSGSVMFDKLEQYFYGLPQYYKITKTTKVKYPYVLDQVVSRKDNLVSESTNKNWDWLTGVVTSRLEKSPSGLYLKTVTKPAYLFYPDMGSKAEDVNRKNMLVQTAASYSYLSNSAGAEVNLLSASVNIWKKDWNNYRIYNSTTQSYADGSEGADVWRLNSSWLYKGTYGERNANGSLNFLPSSQFNFTAGANNTGWIKMTTTDKYDHYNMPLQTYDLNGIYSATKMGYDNRIPIAQASNAKYEEIAFTSAEDMIDGTSFFGGEIRLGNGTVKYKSKGQVAETHTGDAVVSLTSGSALLYTPKASELKPNRMYKASVWTNSTDGRLSYSINGANAITSSPPTIQKKAGNWYLVNMDIPVGATISSLEIGVVTSGGSDILFDDFRFQPADAAMTCFVGNPLTFEFAADQHEFIYTLDNENMFVKQEYNERGRLIKTYRESFKYGVKLISENKDNYRRFHINQ